MRVIAPRRGSSLLAVLSLLFGVGALVITLVPLWSGTQTRLVWSTVGLTSIVFGVTHLWRCRRGWARGRTLAALGMSAGAAATALLAWGVLWSEVPGVPAPPQVAWAGAFTPKGVVQPAVPAPWAAPVDSEAGGAASGMLTPPGAESPADDRSYELRAARVVPAAPNAREVEPIYQLQANLVAEAYEICLGLRAFEQQYGVLPESLSVAGDGKVFAGDVVISHVLSAYMRLSYSPWASDGTALVTVADAESGMAMSCVRSGDEGWITNS